MRGQAMVEFAFVSVMFVMLIFGVIDLGQAVISYNMVAEAARAGARAGMISQTNAAVNAAAYAEVDQSLNTLQVTNAVFCTSLIWPNCQSDPKYPQLHWSIRARHGFRDLPSLD